MKVGLALALVSLAVLLQDVFEKIGQNAMWAVMTVVVVSEYTVGATLKKGLNRGLGTALAALLALAVDYIGNFMGVNVEPVFVGCSVFLIGMLATYTRFVPTIKARYDYGVVIFLLTFSLVVVSGYRQPDSVNLVMDRVITVIAGVTIWLIISTLIFPIWAGDDLLELVIRNAEDLAEGLEGCLREYVQGMQGEVVRGLADMTKACKGLPHDEDEIHARYQQVIISKQNEESLANFTDWEAWRGHHGCRYPWKRLLEVGTILRHCACTLSALHSCLRSEIQVPDSMCKVFANPCITIAHEIAVVLRDVAKDIHKKQKSRSKESMLEPVKQAVSVLQGSITTYPCLFVNPEKGPKLGDEDLMPVNAPHARFSIDRSLVSESLPVLAQQKTQKSVSLDADENMLPSVQINGALSYVSASCFPQSMACVGPLAVSSTISLLFNIMVARLECLLDALEDFQDEAGFKEHVDDVADKALDINQKS